MRMDGELLRRYGVNLEQGLYNCVGDVEFYKQLLSMFLEDRCFANAQAAHGARDYNKLFAYMHELKGVTGNTALADLYAAIVPLVELLRTGTDQHADVDRLFAQVEAAYLHTCEGIRLALA